MTRWSLPSTKRPVLEHHLLGHYSHFFGVDLGMLEIAPSRTC